MAHLTLQEVIERINKSYPLPKNQRAKTVQIETPSHRPEFYIPRIALRLANLKFIGLAK